MGSAIGLRKNGRAVDGVERGDGGMKTDSNTEAGREGRDIGTVKLRC